MKNLGTLVLCVGLTLSGLCSFAQSHPIPITEPDYNKPKLFQDLPERISIDVSNLQFLFNSRVGQSVSIPLTTGFSFEGQVVSTSDASDLNVKSVVIKSTNRIGARLTFTKVMNGDAGTTYIGRIISLQHGDTFEIASENGQYYFKKKGLYDLVNE
jgi:hypothetical protein